MFSGLSIAAIVAVPMVSCVLDRLSRCDCVERNHVPGPNPHEGVQVRIHHRGDLGIRILASSPRLVSRLTWLSSDLAWIRMPRQSSLSFAIQCRENL